MSIAAMKPEAKLFDGFGNSVPRGGSPIDTFDMRCWPYCQLIAEESAISYEPTAILLLPTVGPPLIDALILGLVVDALDNGGILAIHAPDGDTLAVACGAILPLLGAAGNA
jgi:hypothetical protein